MAHKEIDHITGTETTGHSWDGDLKELNTPLPKWWLTIFWITVVWAIGYMAYYPSWIIGDENFKGYSNWTARGDVHQALEDANARLAPSFAKLQAASLADIRNDADLSRFATKAGEAVFGDNCVACHGTGANGVFNGSGYPSLVDKDWLWGGSLESIIETIRVGIRSGHDEERINTMVAYGGKDGQLTPEQIKNVSGFVLSLSGDKLEGADINAGKTIYLEDGGCNACHGDDGKGGNADILGAPNLTDSIWLFGKDKVIASITHGRSAVMPAWDKRLTPAQIKAVAVYVHSRGGGQ